ncbi:hypothetical protein CENSYa_1512 [Cenarchaeum symbiosum A]|uniref:DDE domain-containing protein n=1 Tax=Cenarchaeum symbiosum (strain A) TaxID=414004 RepID=A0RXR7_CENSY|nr:hypothetical protein CENSYa_1512 [Cenarchaeum symbiosum A]
MFQGIKSHALLYILCNQRQMKRKHLPYVPRMDERELRPRTCGTCDSHEFYKFHDEEKQFTRYTCKCKRIYTIYDTPRLWDNLDAVGIILDGRAKGYDIKDVKENVLRYASLDISAQTVSNWTKKYIPIIRMYTDDILSCLEYGKDWGMDETVITLRGKSGEGDPEKVMLAENATAAYKNAQEENKEDWKIKRKENAKRNANRNVQRSKGNTSANSILWYVTGVIDLKTRILMRYIITKEKPNNEGMYRLIRTCVLMAGFPKKIRTDCYKAYETAYDRLKEDDIIPQNTELMQRRSKTGHNGHIEALWNRLKRKKLLKEYGEGFKEVMHAAIIQHNFIKGHSVHKKQVTARSEEIEHKMNKTPAMAGGHPIWYNGFGPMLRAARNYDKSFIFSLEDSHKGLAYVSDFTHNVDFRTVPGVQRSDLNELDRKLKTSNSFRFSGRVSDDDWWRFEVQSLPHMWLARHNLDRPYHRNRFLVSCRGCWRIGCTIQAVSEMMEDRHDGVESCLICRSKGCTIKEPLVVFGYD